MSDEVDFLHPTAECDLVMKGGITSGIVYPPAVLELAPRYRFRDTKEGIADMLTVGGFSVQHVRRIPKEISGKNTYLNFLCTHVPRL